MKFCAIYLPTSRNSTIAKIYNKKEFKNQYEVKNISAVKDIKKYFIKNTFNIFNYLSWKCFIKNIFFYYAGNRV